MTDIDLSPEISAAFAKNWKKVEASGRAIDQEFVRRGFVSIQVEIDFLNEVYGPNAYSAFLDAQSTPEKFEAFREHLDQVRHRVNSASISSERELNELWDVVLADPLLPGYSKDEILRRYFRARHELLVSPHVSMLRSARALDEHNLCRLYPEPAVLLHDKSHSALRKEVCCAVMADAYGALGFSKLKRKKGVDSFAKTLTPELSVIIDPDPLVLERNYTRPSPNPSVYWSMIPYDRHCYLGSSNKQDNRQLMTFLPIANCVAATRLRSYDDTRSFEVLIRADALWFEIAIAPCISEIWNTHFVA